MRFNVLEPGEWSEVMEALISSGIPPRTVLRAAIRHLKVRISKMKTAREKGLLRDQAEAGLKALLKLDSKYSKLDKYQVKYRGSQWVK